MQQTQTPTALSAVHAEQHIYVYILKLEIMGVPVTCNLAIAVVNIAYS